MKKLRTFVMLLIAGVVLGGCAGTSKEEPLYTVPLVDLNRYMGDWYVIASIPTVFDAKAYAATESYAWNDDGSIAVTYRYLKGGFDGEEKIITSTARVFNAATKAEWRMRFFWPLRSIYIVIYLEPDYSIAMVGHPSRDYVWILSRTPSIPDTKYSDLIVFLQQRGYDISKIRKMPQKVG